jgi:hypothetical protein
MSDRQRNVGFDDLRVATGEVLDGADPASDALETLLELVRDQESEQFIASGSSDSPLRALPRPEDEEDADEDDEDDDDDDDETDDDEDDPEDWDYDWEEGDDDDDEEGEGGDDEEEF